MVTKLYTEAELDALRSTPKRITNPGARWLEKPKARPAHRQRSFQAAGEDQAEERFLVYQRQNLDDASDFSCGIAFLPRGAPPLTLARYNGPSHEHGDSEKAIAADKKAESDAAESDRFESLEGALACLMEDFNVSGMRAQPDTRRLI